MNGSDEPVPRETRALWEALEQAAPEPLPAEARARIRDMLRTSASGLSGTAPERRSAWGWAAAVVAALLLGGAGGYLLGPVRGGAAPGPASARADERSWLLLVHDNEASDRAVREQGMEAVVARYAAWAGELAEEDRLVAAEHLAPDPMWIGETTSRSSPISGFFLIRAGSAEEALAIARRSPHVELGGVLEVRAVEGAEGR